MNKIVFRFLNVGQGDSTHIILPDGRHMLVDMNLDRKNHGIDVQQYLADELPQGEKKKRLALLVNTHPHDDHICGMGGLGNQFEIDEMWDSGHERDCKKGENESYDKFVALKEDLGDKVRKVCAKSEPWAKLGDVTFHAFRPSAYVQRDTKETEKEKREAIHNQCMVLRVSYAGRAVMLTGDSSRAAWENIVKHYNKNGALKADALHASHHGSRTYFKKDKEDEAWTEHLEAIDPGFVIVSVGADNEHEHPHDDALELYDNGEREIYRTDENLTIVLTVDEDGNMAWEMDDQDFQDKYQLPDPDDDNDDDRGNSGSKNGKAAKNWGAAIVSKTRLGDSSPTA